MPEAEPEDNDNEADEDDEAANANPSSPVATGSRTTDSATYNALLVKARKFSHGEKLFKCALIQHCTDRLDELVQAGATDHERVKAHNEALMELKRYVCDIGLFLPVTNNPSSSHPMWRPCLESQLLALLQAHLLYTQSLLKGYTFLGRLRRLLTRWTSS